MACTKHKSPPFLSVRNNCTLFPFCKTHAHARTPMSGVLLFWTSLIWKDIFTWTAQGIQWSLFHTETSSNGHPLPPLHHSILYDYKFSDVSHWRPSYSLLSREQRISGLTWASNENVSGFTGMKVVVLRSSEPEAEWRHCACISCNHLT